MIRGQASDDELRATTTASADTREPGASAQRGSFDDSSTQRDSFDANPEQRISFDADAAQRVSFADAAQRSFDANSTQRDSFDSTQPISFDSARPSLGGLSKWVMFGAVFLITAEAGAAGLSTTESSAVAMGAGGTGTARSSDAAAGYYNPAAVTGEAGFRLSLGAVLASARLEASNEAFNASTDSGLAFPPNAHLSWSNDMFAAGASFTIPFGSSVRWKDDWERRFDVQEASFTVRRISAFFGGKIGPVSIAAGPFVDLATLETRRAIDFIEAEGSAKLETTATGFGGHAGVFVRAVDSLDIGLTYRSRAKLSFAGFADFSVPAELSGRAFDQAITAEVTLPDRIALGAVWRLNKEIELAADFEVYLWNTFDALVIDFAEEATSDVTQARDWSPTFVPRLGGSYAVLDWLTVRAGAFIDPSPTPSNTAGPSSPDSTRLGVALGASAQLPWGIDVALAYQHLEFLGVTSEAEDTKGIRFSGAADLVGLSLGLQL